MRKRLLIALVAVLGLTVAADACTSAIVSGKLTANGRPLLWKNRDTNDLNNRVERIKGHFPDALAVDMESGAIAQVCYLSKVPFLALRVISDSPGASHDNTRQYLDFWADAPRETFMIVKDIINNL